jgi:hypothetical protein
MEEWERVLREKLDLEIPEGIYSIVIEGKKYLTGKYGVIDHQVEIARESLKKEDEL